MELPPRSDQGGTSGVRAAIGEWMGASGLPTGQPTAVLAYDTNGDGRMDAFDTNQDGFVDTHADAFRFQTPPRSSKQLNLERTGSATEPRPAKTNVVQAAVPWSAVKSKQAQSFQHALQDVADGRNQMEVWTNETL